MAHESLRPATLPRANDAVAQGRERLEIQRSLLGDRHPDYANDLNHLALLLIMHGDPDEAEPLLRQAMEIRKDTLGEDHPDYATNLSSLAGLLWARGDLDAAEPLLRQALDIRRTALGARHPKSVASLSSLEHLLGMKCDPSSHLPGPSTRPDPAHVAAAVDPDGSATHSTPDDTDVEAGIPSSLFLEPEPGLAASAGPSRMIHKLETETETGTETGPPAELVGSPDLAVLRDQLDAVASEWSRLGEELSRAAEALQGRGVPAPEQLADDLRSGRARFAGLRETMARSAEALGIPATDIRAVADRDGLASSLSELAAAVENTASPDETQRQALSVLDRLLALRHADLAEFPPLRACQARARERRVAIAASRPFALPGDAAELATGAHPFAALVALASGDDPVSDDRWTELIDAVHHEFGKPLAVAVGRARIVLPGHAPAAHP